MNLDVFTDDNFNAVDWINSSYDENIATFEGKKEAFVASIVAQLQSHVQKVNTSLEETSQQVITSMPKICNDVQNLRIGAQSLQSKMSEVQNEIAQVQRETGSCMANLERLDTLKTKLQSAKQGLQESDGWGRLTSELEDLLEQSDMAGACEKIYTLHLSLAAQVGLPGQQERETEVEEAKNRLEALASTHVVKCFTTSDVEQARHFVTMFTKIERLAQLKQYYRTVQKATLQRHWTEIVELAETTNSVRFLREYYDYLGEMWQKQAKYCEEIFVGDERACLEPNQILVETLSGLSPSRETAILQTMKRSTEKLEVLQEISSANVFFGDLLQHLFRSQPNIVHVIPKEQMVALSRGIYDYFGTFIGHYTALEQNWLANQLVAQVNLNEPLATDSIRVLGQSNGKVMQQIHESLRRCESITRNCAIGSLMTVLVTHCRDYMDKYGRAQRQLEASRATEDIWALIQSCTTLMQHIGDFMVKVAELEQELVQVVGTAYEQVLRQELSAFQYKILKRADVNDLKKWVNLIQHQESKNAFVLFGQLIEGSVKSICRDVHETTLLSIMGPIEAQLRKLEGVRRDDLLIHDQGHGDSSLPAYSFAPQEYITEIGQYLMMLPQPLEPFLLSPSKELRLALETALEEKYGRDEPCGNVLLALIAEDTCALFLEQVVKMPELTNGVSKQLATDIEYLGSVLEELGLTLSGMLQQTATLLRAPAENYLNVSAGCEPKLVMTIRQKRNLILNDS